MAPSTKEGRARKRELQRVAKEDEIRQREKNRLDADYRAFVRRQRVEQELRLSEPQELAAMGQQVAALEQQRILSDDERRKRNWRRLAEQNEDSLREQELAAKEYEAWQ